MAYKFTTRITDRPYINRVLSASRAGGVPNYSRCTQKYPQCEYQTTSPLKPGDFTFEWQSPDTGIDKPEVLLILILVARHIPQIHARVQTAKPFSEFHRLMSSYHSLHSHPRSQLTGSDSVCGNEHGDTVSGVRSFTSCAYDAQI